MSLKYIARIEDDIDYHINNNFDTKSLLTYSEDLQKAKKEIEEMERLIFEQYNRAVLAVKYYRVISERHKDSYGADKKVKIRIYVESFMKLEGKEVKSSREYNTFKEFGYTEKKEALSYVMECLERFQGSLYYNNSTYKFMEV